MNNNHFSKRKKNLGRKIYIKILFNRKEYLKWTSQLSYISYKVFDNNLMIIQKIKVALTIIQPAYIGMSILELRKGLMYKLHYDYIKNNCANNSRLLITDTNSLTKEIKTEDVYEDFNNDKEIVIFRNYYVSQNAMIIQKS